MASAFLQRPALEDGQQGITGQLVAASTGALFSIIFYMRKYDLWFMVIIHGVFNTLGIFSFYFGLA